MEIDVKVDFKKLKNVIEEMSKEYSIKVGILANKGGTDLVSKDLDVAGLGAVSEFGVTINVTEKMRNFLRCQGLPLKKETKTITIPARSFIYASLSRSAEIRKKVKKLVYSNDSIETLEKLILQGDKGLLEVVASAIAISAVEQIQDAFDTSGFGEWQQNHPYTIEKKGSAMPLIDTGRLRNSITFEIEKG